MISMKEPVKKVISAILGLVLAAVNYYMGTLLDNFTGIFIVFFMNLIIGMTVLKVTKNYIYHLMITVCENIFLVWMNLFIILFRPAIFIGYEGILIFLAATVAMNMPCWIKIYLGQKNQLSDIYLKYLTGFFTVAYLILLGNLLFVSGRYGAASRQVSLIPFKTIVSYLQSIFYSKNYVAIVNIVGNIVLFVPIGFVFSIYIKNRLLNFMILFMVPICIEILQFIMALGVTDIDDVILNIFGEMIGALLFWLLIFLQGKITGKVSNDKRTVSEA